MYKLKRRHYFCLGLDYIISIYNSAGFGCRRDIFYSFRFRCEIFNEMYLKGYFGC
jgi:hypothetical protein